ncbi:SRPBCC family protein [Vibrio sp. VB16]|uniref:SRPBCC family protein n=1 Tax=Vibrio sp. VB16 TaxID=2785746 RepID=UPI00189E3496|nr:SRPBCC domain-containing protein [Vibrio sp. VB16]UGA56617.1 SRPBCC domain-containing protein [Vibrio sp. VB16]
MQSILHKIVIEASPNQLFRALTTTEGLSNWWTKTEQKGDELTFSFGPNGEHQVVMTLLSSIPDKEVRWQCTGGPWVETGEFVFSISADDRGSCLRFAHHGWEQPDDFYQHCNAKWGFFLVISLKQYLETKIGQPHPNDPSI